METKKRALGRGLEQLFNSENLDYNSFEKQIYDILKSYSKEELSDNKKKLISKYLLEKKQMLRTVYFGEEE